jgi:hypothetical protein
MDINSDNDVNNINNDKYMIVNNEDPEIFWNSAILIIVIILLGILMFYKLNYSTGNCVTNFDSLAGTIDANSIMSSIKL